MAKQHTETILHSAGAYIAVFEQARDGTWTGHVPDLPGVLGMVDTLEQAKRSVQEAIGYWIDDMTSRGQPIPQRV
jgi:predicted RNase H-like HicB family nuclease